MGGRKLSYCLMRRVSDWSDELVLDENHLGGGGGYTTV